MKRARLLACVALGLLCCVGNITGQSPAPQTSGGTPRPGIAPPAKSVAPDAPATLHGRVIAADSGTAIRGAQVELRGMGDPNNLHRVALTNREGRYRFEGLPPGRYQVHASRPAFLDMYANQNYPNESGDFWKAEAGQTQQVDFALPRGGVVSGRITDDAGEPLVGIQVMPLRLQHSGNGSQLRPFYSMPFRGITDDRGEFRIPGLSPGTYVVAADLQNNVVGESYAPTYYPGTTKLSEASRLRIGLSQQFTANFSMMLTRQVRVTGQVRSSKGVPVQSYRLALRSETSVGSRGGQTNGAAGTFEFQGVPPGSYILEVSTAGNSMDAFMKPSEFAAVPIEVGEADVTGLLITTGFGTTIRGRVTYAGSSARNATREKAGVSVIRVDGPYMWPHPRDENNGLVAEDGSFTITTYGKVLFRAWFSGWQLKSVMLDGADITDVPYDATRRGGTDRLEIVVTDERQELTGRVINALGKPPDRYRVLVFPSVLKEGAVPGRFISNSWQSESDGTFRISNLPPGDYLAVALASPPQDAQFDPDFRDAIKPRATPFHLLPGQTTKLELTLIE